MYRMFLMIFCSLIVISSCKFDSNSTENKTEFLALFEEHKVLEIHLMISPESWVKLEENPRKYSRVTFIHDRQTLEVGLRLKGMASFRPISDKPALKIKFNKYDKEQYYKGLSKLTLNNMVQDESMMRECIGYAFFRSLGLVAPLCNHAKVFINEEYYGLYSNVQTMDEEFIRFNFPGKIGNLYDIDGYGVDFKEDLLERFELDTNKDTEDYTSLIKLTNALSSYDRSFQEIAKENLDYKKVMLLGALEAVVSHWDGYFNAQNNYKAYHQPDSDKFVLLPWGIDQIFKVINHEIDGSNTLGENGIIYRRCKQDRECLGYFKKQVNSVLEAMYHFDLDSKITMLESLLEVAIQEDMKKPYTTQEQEKSVALVRQFLQERPQLVRAQLESL